jgi:hypothetical protein
MCLLNARFSKYSIMPTAALAVQEPSLPWFSTGEHHFLKSTDVSAFSLVDATPSFLISGFTSVCSCV